MLKNITNLRLKQPYSNILTTLPQLFFEFSIIYTNTIFPLAFFHNNTQHYCQTIERSIFVYDTLPSMAVGAQNVLCK